MAFQPQGVPPVKPPLVADIEEERKKRAAAEAESAKTDGDGGEEPKPSPELLFAEYLRASKDFRIGGRQDNNDIDQSLFRWTNSHWELMHEAVARKLALTWLKDRRKHKCSQAMARSALATATDFMVDEDAHMLSSLERRRGAACTVIPVEGAYLFIDEDGVIIPHKPFRDVGLTYTVPAHFDRSRCNEDGTYTPRDVDPNSAFGRYLDRFMPDPGVRRLLQEAAAASVLSTNYETAWVLSGTGSNGKSTFLHILRRIHPFNTSLRLKTADGRFGFQNVAGKTLVIATEVPDFIGKDAEQNLKSLISRDPIEIERKGRDAITVVPRATLFLAMNEALKFTDHTYGNERKYQTIPFVVQMPKNSPDRVLDFHKLITDDPKEMAGVLDWILAGAARLKKQKGFSPLPASVEAFARESRLTTDNVASFMDEYEVKHDATVWTTKMRVYELYKSYCLERTLKPVSEPQFWLRVRECFNRQSIALGDKQVQVKNERVRAVQLRVRGVQPANALV
jgi:P4 family phage/plasmid primase-like protien